MRILLRTVVVACLLLAGAVASGPAAQAAVNLRYDTFERPARGSAYPLGQWAQDGWSAPWDLGMSNRTWIDGYNFSHSGGQSLRVFYPKGKIGPEDSGAQAPFTLAKAREYYLSYWVRFSSDFSWGTTEYAGKVGLGLAGGAACSGGQVCDGLNGFSSRMIWRTGGKAAIYYYDMGHAGQYGDFADLTRPDGSLIYYPRGQWVNLVQRVRVNTVTNGAASPDGEIDVWFNGVQAATLRGLRFVANADQVDKAYFSSFAGGATASFAPANDSWIWYDDLKVSTERADICELAAGGCHTRSFEAENYNQTNGVTTTTTTDTGGGRATTFATGQWTAFTNVTIPKAAKYLVEYRVATSGPNAKLSLDINEGATPLGDLALPDTGGLTQYRTVSREIQVPAGTYQFGLYAVTGGLSLNWWRLTQIG